jgi:hypothetical protein
VISLILRFLSATDGRNQQNGRGKSKQIKEKENTKKNPRPEGNE